MSFILAFALTALAQEKPLTTTKQNEDTVRLTVSGEAELEYVWRRQELTAFTGGVSGTNVPGNSSSENTFEGFVALRLNADLSDQVYAVVEIGTKRVDAGLINYFAAGSAAQQIQLREARIVKKELFMTELSLEMGITTWGFDVRGKGSSMAFDLRHSQRFNRNHSSASDNGGTMAARASDPEELEPLGFWLRYDRTAFALDLVALPAVIEGGSVHNDEALYAADVFYTMDSKGSRFGFITAVVSDPGGAATVLTYGGGVDWKGTPPLDVYVEAYSQTGRIAQGVTASGFAFQVGAEYVFSGDLQPWVGVNLTYYSGDKDAAPNGRASVFSAYENIHDLIILEDLYRGLDWDSNYRAIKLGGGVALSAGGEQNLKLSALLGICHTAQTVRFAAETTHKLGNEVDLKVEWGMTRQLSLSAAFGFLFGSKVLEDSMGGPGAPDAEPQSLLFTLGTDIRF